MSAESSPPLVLNSDDTKYANSEKAALGEPELTVDGISIGEGQDILSLQGVDPALNAKMHLVNNVRSLCSIAGIVL